jgi:hypothetical protein
MRQEDRDMVTIAGVGSAPELRFRVKYRAGPHLLLEKQ